MTDTPRFDRTGALPGPARSLAAAASRLRDALLEPARRIDALQLFEELRERLSVLGVGESAAEVDEFGLDQGALDRVEGLLDFLFERWWRVRVTGLESLPADGPLLFVANRSGVLPYDALMVAHAVTRERGERARPRFLVADWLVGLPFSQALLARVGGVRACAENADRLLASGHSVIAFPEGQKGALKPFADRYQLQRFARGGFVPLALRRSAPIVPVAVVGAEEVHPVLTEWSLASRLLGVPFPITPTFPLLGPLGAVPLPSRWRIRFGEPIDLAGAGSDPDDPLLMNRARERVRGAIRDLLAVEVRARRSVF